MVPVEEICNEEWAEWYGLTPQERWARSQALWPVYLMLGGTLDAEPDSQSPFDDPGARSTGPADGQPGMRVLRRSGI